ncbi:hypothetical protein ANN_10327 [Periplaneta americana]|uniref:Reverse transcriptase domain-containing protein n=1 Tax=Periplaneta americana TaxID=6978 RepID=A0ABQ8TQL0_PERAM|nr:hypothetical protein ANN_10327 [Periplaneta americana]
MTGLCDGGNEPPGSLKANLGITFSSDLGWGEYVTDTAGKAWRALHFVMRVLRKGSDKSKEIAYKSLVRPVMEYGAACWDPYRLEHIKTLENIKKRALKCCRKNSPLKWDTLTDRRTPIQLCALFKTYRDMESRAVASRSAEMEVEQEGSMIRMPFIIYPVQHLLGRFGEELFSEHGRVMVKGTRMKCIRFTDDMVLLAEEEMIMKNMLLKLNDSCEQYGMKINANKIKIMVIGRKIKKLNVRIRIEAVEQVDCFKYLGAYCLNLTSDTNKAPLMRKLGQEIMGRVDGNSEGGSLLAFASRETDRESKAAYNIATSYFTSAEAERLSFQRQIHEYQSGYLSDLDNHRIIGSTMGQSLLKYKDPSQVQPSKIKPRQPALSYMDIQIRADFISEF